MFSLSLALGLVFIFLLPTTNAFAFSAVQNGQCGPLVVTWAGGTPPFTVGIHAIEGTGQAINVPSTEFTNGQGSMEITLQIPTGKNFLVTMGDANGPLTGGTSTLLTSGAQPSNPTSPCNVTYPIPDFFWSANAGSAVTQCRAYPFTDIGTTSSKFKGPPTLFVLVPGGSDSFAISMPNAPSYVWPANVKQGTQILFDMVDSAGNQGGVGPGVYTVGAGDSSCTLHDSSQQSSAAPPSATATSTSSGSLSRGVIIGIACGAVILIGLIGFLIFVLLRRKDRRKGYYGKPVNLLTYEQNYGNYQDLDPYDPVPIGAVAQPYNLRSPTRPHSDYSTSNTSSSYTGYPTTSGSSKRAYMAASRRSSSQAPIIQHSDIADTNEQPPPPMELPPQYSPNRAPLNQYSSFDEFSSPGPSTSSVGLASSSSSGAYHGLPPGAAPPDRSISMRKGPR